jgi:aminocarboxymuconate-semialdehyde decarboxylase
MEQAEVVDIHAHILLPGVMGTCGAAGPEMGRRADGTQYFRAGDYVLENVGFVNSPFSDVELRLEGMDRLGIDRQLVSPNPITYFYHRPVEEAVGFNRRHNDLIGEIVATHPRLVGAAALPLQDPEESCRELHRAVSELGLVCSYLGTDVAGAPLSDPRFEELWAEHERLGVPTVLHPGPRTSYDGRDAFFGPWDLDVIYGFAVDEGLAVAHLLFGGVLDRHPDLHVHVAHGGGFAPYQKGRLEAALEKRPWARDLLGRSFDDQWRQLSFDTAVHRQDALAFLVSTEGADRVLLGSNFAGWDLEEGYLAMIESLGLDQDGVRAILGGNARRLFRLGRTGEES